MIAIGEMIKEVIRTNGFSRKMYAELTKLINNQFSSVSFIVIDFIGASMNAVWEEIEPLKPRQIVLGDSRVIESVFPCKPSKKHLNGLNGQMTSTSKKAA